MSHEFRHPTIPRYEGERRLSRVERLRLSLSTVIGFGCLIFLTFTPMGWLIEWHYCKYQRPKEMEIERQIYGGH